MIEQKKQIAVLSTLYYPVMGAPSACIDKYVQELKKEYDFHIITRNDELSEPKCEMQDIRFFTSRLHELRKKRSYNTVNGPKAFLSRISLGLINALKLCQTQFCFPTAQYWEVKGYLEELEKLHKEYNLDGVIAVSNNFVTQLAALQFKKKTFSSEMDRFHYRSVHRKLHLL